MVAETDARPGHKPDLETNSSREIENALARTAAEQRAQGALRTIRVVFGPFDRTQSPARAQRSRTG